MRTASEGARERTVMLACALGAVVVAALAYATIHRRGDAWSGKGEQTRAHMRVVLGYVYQYYSETGAWPEPSAWDRAVGGYLRDPRDKRTLQERSLDAWGNRFLCQIVGNPAQHGAYRFVSAGPNGRYEDGHGDDIVGALRDGLVLVPDESPSTTTSSAERATSGEVNKADRAK